MQIFVDGIKVQKLPVLNQEQKLLRIRSLAVKFRRQKDLFRFYMGALDAATSH